MKRSQILRDFGIAAALVLVTILAYLPAIRSGYIWDDDKYLTKNALLQEHSGLGRIWFEPQASPQYYPLVFTTFWIENKLWGLKPLGFHLINVLIHAANAILVWRILKRLEVRGAIVIGAIFALHPVHVESVAWITERKNVLSGLFYLLSLQTYLRWAFEENKRKPGLYLTALALFLCALLSKSVTATMPAAVLVIIWWKRGRISGRDIAPLIPFFILGLALSLHTAWLERHHVGAERVEWGLSVMDRFLIAGRVVWFYIYKLVWPRQIIFFYPRWQIDAGQPWQFLFPIAALGVLVLLWRLRSRIGRGPLAAALFFCGTLFPVLGFVPVYPMIFSWVADHFQYLASIGIIALVVSAIATRVNSPPVAVCLAFLVLGAAAARTWARCSAYRNEEQLWLDTIAQNDKAWAAYNNLGSITEEKGNSEEALQYFQKAIALRPRFQIALDNLGTLYMKLHRDDEAFEAFRQAVADDPNYPSSQRNYGRALCKRGQFDEGLRRIRMAIEMRPDVYESYEDLANSLFEQGKPQQAIPEYRKVLELKPDYALGEANLGAALIAAGQIDSEAISHLSRAIAIDPNVPVAHYTLGTVLAARGRSNEAIAEFNTALKQQPDNALAHDALAAALASQGKTAEAIDHSRRATQLSPDNPDFHFNLARTLDTAGRREEALREYREVLRINPNDTDARKAITGG